MWGEIMALLKSEQTLSKGDKAPSFTLLNIDGHDVSLSQFKGKPVVIIFMCNHCPYVKAKFEELSYLEKTYTAKGIGFVFINPNDAENYSDDDFAHMKELARLRGYKHYLVDETQEIAMNYGAVCTPDPFVFDKDHKLVYHGRINDAMSPDAQVHHHDLREVLDGLLLGKEIKEWFVPSMGCSIKWKIQP